MKRHSVDTRESGLSACPCHGLRSTARYSLNFPSPQVRVASLCSFSFLVSGFLAVNQRRTLSLPTDERTRLKDSFLCCRESADEESPEFDLRQYGTPFQAAPSHPCAADCTYGSRSQNKLFGRMDGCRLSGMWFRNHTFKAAVASGISLWMAVLACLIGCTLPSSANTGLINASSTRQNSAGRSGSDLMASMGNCPHHSGSNAPAKQNHGKPVRSGGTSCCPVEVTVASKPDTVILHVAAR